MEKAIYKTVYTIIANINQPNEAYRKLEELLHQLTKRHDIENINCNVKTEHPDILSIECVVDTLVI